MKKVDDKKRKLVSFQPDDFPAATINDFFDFSDINNHLETLSIWRDSVMNNYSFVTKTSDPSNLLTRYKFVSELIDSAYDLSLYNPVQISDDEIKEVVERETRDWLFHPKSLSQQEIGNPLLAFKRIFDDKTLSEYNEHLDWWLESGYANAANETITPKELIWFYDALVTMVEASYLLYKRRLLYGTQISYYHEPEISTPVQEDVVTEDRLPKNGNEKNLEIYRNMIAGDEAEPLLTIKAFFDFDTIAGRLSGLDEWRSYILSDKSFGITSNPDDLWFECRENMQLIRAANDLLIWHNNQPASLKLRQYNDDDIELERQMWDDYPHNLNNESLYQPYLVLTEFFSFLSLSKWLNLLDQWLGAGLSNAILSETISPLLFAQAYELMKKIYAALWIINKREPSPLSSEHTIYDITNIQEPPLDKHYLNYSIDELGEELFQTIVAIIRHKVPSTISVHYLGAIREKPNYLFLLIITDGSGLENEVEISNIVESATKGLANITALVFNYSTVAAAINQDDFFICNALRNSLIICLTGKLLLPKIPVPRPNDKRKPNITLWDRWIGQAINFLIAARNYNDGPKPNMAIYMLHQALISSLVALIKGITGYPVPVNNLSRMIRITEMFTPEIVKCFDLNTLDGIAVFTTLQTVNHDTWHNDVLEFNAHKDQLEMSLQKIELCINTCRSVFYNYWKLKP